MKWLRIEAIFFHYLYDLTHNLFSLVEVFFWPIFNLLIWGFTSIFLKNIGQQGFSIVNLFLGSIILWVVVFRSQQEITSCLLGDVLSRNLRNFLISPLKLSELFMGIILTNMIKLLITIAVLLILAFFVFNFNIFHFGFELIPFMISLIIFGWSLGIFASGLILYFGTEVMFISWTLSALLQPLSCVFYPRSILPSVFKTFSWLIPTSYIFEGMRNLAFNNNFLAEDLILSFALDIFYLLLAVLFFKILFNRAQKKGNLARF